VTGTIKANIGCGRTHHPDWINLDVSSSDPSVRVWDVTRGLPFPDSSVEACYSSHVLEHLDKRAAENLIKDCFRVLRRGGVIRLVVPDLEQIAREYLRLLEIADNGNFQASLDYDWILLEMYDQVARNKSGGEMADFLAHLPASQRTYVLSRVGAEAVHTWTDPPAGGIRPLNMLRRGLRELPRLLRIRLAGWLVRLAAGRSASDSFRRGCFRDGGEVHQWMYDRYSLRRLLNQAGFVDIQLCSADESRIAGYENYSLDMHNGVVRKPDSLFVEASKP